MIGASSGRLERRDALAFWLLVAFVAVMYTAPSEWIPALAPLRLALVTSSLAFGLLLLRRLGRGQRLALDGPRGLALGAFALFALGSMAWSLYPDVSRSAGLEALKFVAIYVALVNLVTTPRRLTLLCGALVLASIATSAGALDWYRTGVDLVEGYRTRWVGIYADPNRMAMSIGLVVPLAIAFAMQPRMAPWMRLASAVAATLGIAAMVLSYSRGGFLGLSVALALWTLRERKLHRTAVVALAFAFLVVLAPDRFWNRTETLTSFGEDASAMGRVHAWEVAANISADRPLLGTGAGTFIFAWPLYAPVEARRAYAAHNVFLQVIGELGWVGFALFLLFVGGAVAGAWEASRHPEVGWLGRALVAAIAGYLVCNLFAGFLLTAHLYVLFGLAASAQRIAHGEVALATLPEAPVPALGGPAPIPARISH